MTIAENGGTTAADLGVRSFDADVAARRAERRRGVRTVDGADFRVTRSDGTTFDVDLPTAHDGAGRDRRDQRRRRGGGGVTASLAATGNGIVLTDTAGGAGTLTVDAAELLRRRRRPRPARRRPAGNVITGADVNPVEASGVFANLAQLRDALRANDQQGITAAAEGLKADYERVVARSAARPARACRSSRAAQDRLEDQNLATKSLLSTLEDADITEAISRFQTLQTALQASMQTSASMLNLSLLDFLG